MLANQSGREIAKSLYLNLIIKMLLNHKYLYNPLVCALYFPFFRNLRERSLIEQDRIEM